MSRKRYTPEQIISMLRPSLPTSLRHQQPLEFL